MLMQPDRCASYPFHPPCLSPCLMPTDIRHLVDSAAEVGEEFVCAAAVHVGAADVDARRLLQRVEVPAVAHRAVRVGALRRHALAHLHGGGKTKTTEQRWGVSCSGMTAAAGGGGGATQRARERQKQQQQQRCAQTL